MNIKIQINLNVELELLVSALKDLEYKFNKKLNLFKFKINDYTKKIKKAEQLSNKDISYKVRSDIYIDTCKSMIEHYEDNTTNSKKMFASEYEFIKEQIWSKLNAAIVSKDIDESTLVLNEKCIVYSIPSAKLVFQKQYIYIKNEKELKSFLASNNLDFIKDDFTIDMDNFEKDLEIADDNSVVITETGQIVNGIAITDHDLSIVY